MWLGRYAVGSFVPLACVPRSANNAPGTPSSCPVAEIYNASGTQVGSDVSLVVHDVYGTGTATYHRFQRLFRLTSSYSAGRYMILYKWTISGTQYVLCQNFDVYSGEADGQIIAMFPVNRPEGQHVHYDTQSGKTLVGKNPK